MYKGFNHFQKLKKTLQKTLHKRANIKHSWVSVAGLHKSTSREKGSTVLTLAHKNRMQISHYLPQHSNILNPRYRYGCCIMAEIFQNKHTTLLKPEAHSWFWADQHRPSWGIAWHLAQGHSSASSVCADASSLLLCNLLPTTYTQEIREWKSGEKCFPCSPCC